MISFIPSTRVRASPSPWCRISDHTDASIDRRQEDFRFNPLLHTQVTISQEMYLT